MIERDLVRGDCGQCRITSRRFPRSSCRVRALRGSGPPGRPGASGPRRRARSPYCGRASPASTKAGCSTRCGCRDRRNSPFTQRPLRRLHARSCKSWQIGTGPRERIECSGPCLRWRTFTGRHSSPRLGDRARFPLEYWRRSALLHPPESLGGSGFA